MTTQFRHSLLGALLVFVLVALVTFPWQGRVHAQQTAVGDNDAYAFQTVTVSTVAIGVTAATASPTNAAGARQLFCSVESQPIRYRFDGVAPTSAVGHPATAGSVITLLGTNNILRFRAIRSGATDATLSCTLSR